MTPPKTYQYQIQYTDNTYRMVDWTKGEFKQVADDMKDSFDVTVMDDGIFVLKDIRTIVLIPEVEEPKLTDEQKKEGQLTEWGFVDPDTAVYLKEVLGIDSQGGN
jgi:hypothetical protein